MVNVLKSGLVFAISRAVLELIRMAATRLDAEIQPALLFLIALIAAAITIAVSQICFRYVEAPLLRLRAGFRPPACVR